MARNGSGTYVLPAGNPVVTGSTISSTWANNTLNDMATALTGSIAKDGQTTPTGNLPMGGYKHTSVADATVRAEYASSGQVQDGAFTLLSSVSGTNAITATAALGMSSYVAGQRFNFVAAGDNTGAVTININSVGAKSVTKNGTTALAAGEIKSGALCQIVYDGTQFQLLNPTSVTSFSAGTTGLTPSSATTGAVTLAGTLAVANGGTGSTSLTANNVILGNGTSAVQTVAPSTSGYVLTSNGTTWASAINPTLGAGQTWQDVTSSRSVGTTYTNSTGKPIMVNIKHTNSSGTSSLTITVDSVVVSSFDINFTGASINLGSVSSVVVPNGSTYTVAATSMSISSWIELR